MADLLDPASLPEGVSIRIACSLDGGEVVHLAIDDGALPKRAHLVLRRRQALALGLQLSQAAHRLAPEDRG